MRRHRRGASPGHHPSGPSTLVSLLWRPVLPPGWAITNVIADGGPELVNGEMVWTGATVPPSPLHVLYFVQVPASERTSSQSIHDEVEYQALGMLNPLSAVANPDPEIITLEYVQFDQVQKLPNGSFKLSMSGSIDSPVRLLAAPGLFGPWTVLTNFPSVNAPIEYVVTPSTHVPAQFYRLVSP